MLKIQNVGVCFDSTGAVSAVENIDLTLKARTKTVLIGETGSGKSVLLLAILRLLPATAKISGSVIFDGRDLQKLSEKELEKIRGARISYIPQGSGNGMNPLMTVGFQVGEPLLEHRGLSRKAMLGKSVELLRRFNLGREEAAAKAYPHMFSGGMRQRAMVAMGVAAGADIILADEPTKGLDYSRIGIVSECFNSLTSETILCVTHDIVFAKSIGDQISVMYAAQQIEDASCSDFFKHPLHPYSRAILNAMPENGLTCNIGFAPSHESYGKYGCRFADRCEHKSERCKQSPPMVDKGGHRVRCWLYAA